MNARRRLSLTEKSSAIERGFSRIRNLGYDVSVKRRWSMPARISTECSVLALVSPRPWGSSDASSSDDPTFVASAWSVDSGFEPVLRSLGADSPLRMSRSSRSRLGEGTPGVEGPWMSMRADTTLRVLAGKAWVLCDVIGEHYKMPVMI